MNSQYSSPLRALRLEKNLTQNQVANQCNTSRERMSVWENSHALPGLSYQVKLAQAFKIPLQQLQTICNWPLTPDVVIVGLEALK